MDDRRGPPGRGALAFAAMGWSWRYADDAGAEPAIAGTGADFPSQADAESWLGEVWRSLAEAGVASVTLLEDGREVYGPMSLRPAD